MLLTARKESLLFLGKNDTITNNTNRRFDLNVKVYPLIFTESANNFKAFLFLPLFLTHLSQTNYSKKEFYQQKIKKS